MSIGETHRNLDDFVKAAAVECGKPGAALMVPWRIETNQDHFHNGLEQCGCAFSPGGKTDDDERPEFNAKGMSGASSGHAIVIGSDILFDHALGEPGDPTLGVITTKRPVISPES